MYALICAGKVAQLEEKTFPVHESLSWIEVDANVSVGDIYENGSFESPPVTVNTIPDTVFQKATKRMIKNLMSFNKLLVAYVNGEKTKTQLNDGLALLQQEYDAIKVYIENIIQ